MELYGKNEWHRRSIILFHAAIATCFLFVTVVPLENSFRASDQCDWYGSGFLPSLSSSSGIQPVFLRCRAGKIRWIYPHGGLRIILRDQQRKHNFLACFKVASNASGASLYLEKNKRLRLLRGKNTSEDRQLCVESENGQVSLYIEAQTAKVRLQKNVFELQYDLQPFHQKSFSECSPCTNKELLSSFCTSDFVVRGTIASIYQNEHLQRTELSIRGKKVIRDSGFKLFQKMHKNLNRTITSGVVYRPLQCGTRAGVGEFLFLGRWRLGEPILRCAPRWNEWKKIRRKMAFSKKVDCLLE